MTDTATAFSKSEGTTQTVTSSLCGKNGCHGEMHWKRCGMNSLNGKECIYVHDTPLANLHYFSAYTLRYGTLLLPCD